MGSYGRQWELAVTLWKILDFSVFCALRRKRESTESIAYKASLKWIWIRPLNRGGSTAWDVPGRFRFSPERGNCQMTCKPGSVRGLAAPGWPFLWDDRCRPPHATYPRIWRGSRLIRIAPDPSSYAVLLPAGFTMPRPLPAARCALTAPFHPYRRTGRTRVIGGLFSVALSLGSRPPAVNRRRSSMEPGLSSLLPPGILGKKSSHPVIWPR
jgi:hypothetical protein